MEACWANSIGGCAGGISREHILSKSQFFSTSIRVSGFSWCPTPKTIGLSSLVAKNLCRKHNEHLSPSDSEASKLLHALLEINKRTEALKQGRRLPRTVVKIDAHRIEQWLLKTTFNMSLQGIIRRPELFLAGQPNEQLVRVAFGIEDFDEPFGLWWQVTTGQKIEGAQMGALQWEGMVVPGQDRLVAARLLFHGHTLWLALPGKPLSEGLSRGERISFPETACEIQCCWSKRRHRIRRRDD